MTAIASAKSQNQNSKIIQHGIILGNRRLYIQHEHNRTGKLTVIIMITVATIQLLTMIKSLAARKKLKQKKNIY